MVRAAANNIEFQLRWRFARRASHAIHYLDGVDPTGCPKATSARILGGPGPLPPKACAARRQAGADGGARAKKMCNSHRLGWRLRRDQA